MAEQRSRPTFVPFADEAGVRSLGGLSFENGRGRITLHGSLDLTHDRPGLALARDLKATLEAIVAALEQAEAARALPERVAAEPEAPVGRVPNPFA